MNPLPEIIELSDDSSDSVDLQVVQTIEPKIPKKIDQLLVQYDILSFNIFPIDLFLGFLMSLNR